MCSMFSFDAQLSNIPNGEMPEPEWSKCHVGLSVGPFRFAYSSILETLLGQRASTPN